MQSLPILEALEWLPASRLVLESWDLRSSGQPSVCSLPLQNGNAAFCCEEEQGVNSGMPSCAAQDAGLGPACSDSLGPVAPHWPRCLPRLQFHRFLLMVSHTHLHCRALFPELFPGCLWKPPLQKASI